MKTLTEICLTGDPTPLDWLSALLSEFPRLAAFAPAEEKDTEAYATMLVTVGTLLANLWAAVRVEAAPAEVDDLPYAGAGVRAESADAEPDLPTTTTRFDDSPACTLLQCGDVSVTRYDDLDMVNVESKTKIASFSKAEAKTLLGLLTQVMKAEPDLPSVRRLTCADRTPQFGDFVRSNEYGFAVYEGATYPGTYEYISRADGGPVTTPAEVDELTQMLALRKQLDDCAPDAIALPRVRPVTTPSEEASQ